MDSGRVSARFILGLFFVRAIIAGYFILRRITSPSLASDLSRFNRLRTWFRNPAAHADWMVHAGETCGSASFAFPTYGYIGFIWGDLFRPGHRHQGLDIFGGEDAGVTPVVAAYGGYLTRLPDWKSTLIIRLPEDPVQPGRQIWTYYTHMADADGRSYISPAISPRHQRGLRGRRDIARLPGQLLRRSG